jgi:ATP-dependent DNA helicase RecQ
MDHRYQILREKFHLDDFREGQEEVINALLAGRNALAIMPTGSGKSLCYQLPALLLEGVTLVISPLIALMKDQVDSLSRLEIPATFINSSLSSSEQQVRLSALARKEFKLVYIAPERFRNAGFSERIKQCRVGLVAVDEAHCVSEWGHDFRPDYLRLAAALEMLCHPPAVALTATATPEVREDIIRQLALSNPLVVVTGFDRPNLRLEVQEVPSALDKQKSILEIMQHQPGAPGIIYAATRKAVEEVTLTLKAAGHSLATYHAGLPIESRKEIQERFMSGKIPVVAATNAFGMGIDKPDLRFVIHYQIPGSLEAYYQEIGRAGRDGQSSVCRLLYTYADTFTQEFFIDNNYPPREVVLALYRQLCLYEEDEIEIPLKELASRLPFNRVTEMAVSAALKLLDRAGHIERGHEGPTEARIRLEIPARELKKNCQGSPVLSLVANFLVDEWGAWPNETVEASLDAFAQESELEEGQVRRALAAMHTAGWLIYTPPFRGRGIKILERVPVQKLRVDFQEAAKRAEFERHKLRIMINYASSRQCLRHYILNYFGEKHRQAPCHNCTSCAQKEIAATIDNLGEVETLIVRKALSGVARLKGRYGKARVAQMLAGSKEKALSELGINQLSTYGILKEYSQPEIHELLDALVAGGLLKVEGVEYPLLKLTEEGREGMLARRPIQLKFPEAMLRHLHPLSLPKTQPAEIPLSGATANLFETLRTWRLHHAQIEKMPPYIILHDRTLRQMAIQQPGNLAELRQISGFGPDKISRYGEELLRLIKGGTPRGVQRQAFHSKKSAATNQRRAGGLTTTLQSTWEHWQAGKTLEEIASTRQLTRATILDHLADLIRQEYPIELTRLIPEPQLRQIDAAIQQLSTDQLKPLKESLPAEITYDQIRLVVLKHRQHSASD